MEPDWKYQCTGMQQQTPGETPRRINGDLLSGLAGVGPGIGGALGGYNSAPQGETILIICVDDASGRYLALSSTDIAKRHIAHSEAEALYGLVCAHPGIHVGRVLGIANR